jgi:hypothetical protein
LKNEEARLTPAEREREREDVEISPAQPLGPGRIDDDNAKGRPAKTAPKAHVKDDDSHRMTH